MKLKEVIEILNAKIIVGAENNDQDIMMACGSDLMSDVLSFIKARSLLLTGLATEQVIYTAEMADIKFICFVRNKVPRSETVKLAENKNITLISTQLPMFESCGRLHKKGLQGCSERKER
jgi:hypothetical protein